MSHWLTRFFHKPSTAFPQADLFGKMDAQRSELRDLHHKITLMRRDMEDFEERTARKLDRYRKWFSSRKSGKFANQDTEDTAQSMNDEGSVVPGTHQDIAAEARKQGLIS